MQLSIEDKDELVVMEAAILKLKDEIAVSLATIEVLIENNGKEGYPKYSEDDIEILNQDLSDAKKTTIYIKGLERKINILKKTHG